MRHLRRIIKIVLVLLWSILLMLPAVVAILCCNSRTRMRRGAKWAQRWARGAAWCAGVHTRVHGDVAGVSGRLLVSNHLGYLDILAHGAIFPIRFTPKAEIKYWPLLGQLVALNVPVWIDRSSPHKARQYSAEFRATLDNGVSLLVYPEGTSSDGKHGLLPFKSTPFAVTGESDKILPMVLFYREDPAGSAPGAWFGDISFPAHVWGVLGLKRIDIDVFVMPEMQPLPGETRKDLARRVRDAMEKEYYRHEELV